MKIRYMRLRDGFPPLKYQTAGAAGFDLGSAIDIVVEPKSHALVPTGVAIEIPSDHVLFLAARSSLFMKKHLLLGNGIGTIDSDYSGPEDEIKILVWNPGEEAISIAAGERLVNAIFLPITRADFEEAKLEGSSRGGFGTTGGYSL